MDFDSQLASAMLAPKPETINVLAHVNASVAYFAGAKRETIKACEAKASLFNV
jgi:hypothetical protein